MGSRRSSRRATSFGHGVDRGGFSAAQAKRVGQVLGASVGSKATLKSKSK
jgi:hypothetical protein